MPFKYVIVPPLPGEHDLEGRNLTRPFRQFLHNRVRSGLDLNALNLKKGYDPTLMAGMREAVERLSRAIVNGERILIHGDYDADGLTALALMYYALRWAGADVVPFVPDRFNDGYGLSERGVRYAKDAGASLILTVDCGVSSHREIDVARKMGVDVIITDHHQLPEDLPDAVVVHPQVGDYPDHGLTGVGVALKLALALYDRLNLKREALYHLLDLVAVGTVADVGSMLGENRLLVKHGLRVLNSNWEGNVRAAANPGLKAIAESARAGVPIGAWQIGWLIAPRINAAGRMGRVNLAMELLISKNPRRISSLVRELENLNRQRQNKQSRLMRIIRDRVDPSEPIVFVVSEEVDEGVAGILASKLMEEFGRPAVVVSLSEGMARGSIRGIEPFNVYEALLNAGDLFSEDENFGGHTLAGGFSIRKEKLDVLRRKFVSYAHRVSVDGEFTRTVIVDAELSPEDIGPDFWMDMRHFQPYGHGFNPPVFVLRLKGKPVLTSNGYATYLEHYERRHRFRLRLVNPHTDLSGDIVVTSLRIKDGVIYGDVLGSL